MKSLVLAAGLATLLSGTAFAQTTAPATTAPATATTAAPAAAATDVIVILPPMAQGAAPAHFLTDDLEDENIYGANNEEIGEIEDFVMNADGSVAAVVVEVGGFLGIGEKDVLVNWNALQIAVENNDIRITAPTLTREALEGAASVDLDAMVVGRD